MELFQEKKTEVKHLVTQSLWRNTLLNRGQSACFEIYLIVYFYAILNYLSILM
jgi:hypothetical protein